MNFLILSIVSLYTSTLISATDFSNLQFTDPANDDCEPTKKEGTVDINVHYNGRTYDKETDTTTFQYSYQRLLEKSENVLFGIGNCFPDNKKALLKFDNSTCFYGHSPAQVESYNRYEFKVRGDVGEVRVVARKFNDKSYVTFATTGPNCWCRDQGFLCKEEYARQTSKYKCHNYPESNNETCGPFKNWNDKGQLYYPNIGCQVSVKLSSVNNDHRCAYASTVSRLGVQESPFPGVIFYTCDTDYCNPKASQSNILAHPDKVFLGVFICLARYLFT